MYINLLPCITWKWLKMNGSEVDMAPKGNKAVFDVPAGWTLSDDTAAQGSEIDPRSNAAIEKALFSGEIVTGAGPDLDRLVKESDTPVSRITAAEGTLIIENRYADGDEDIKAIEIIVPDGVTATVIEKFYSEENITAKAAFQTKINIGKNAVLKLIQVQSLSSGVDFINDIGTVNAENGRFELVEVLISGGRTYFGSRSNLIGDKSSMKLDMGYIVKGDERLEANIAAFQQGKCTDSLMKIEGTLKDRAFKLMKDTIDFKKGSSGSTGEETEDVLMVSDDAVNQSVPLILCTEEDVEGVHGATLGQLSDEVMTYLQSRGFDRESIFALMEKARIERLCSLIEDEKTVEEIRSILGEDDE